jgi:nicotinamidase-related amidase
MTTQPLAVEAPISSKAFKAGYDLLGMSRKPDSGRDVFLFVDVLDDFGHEDGRQLLASFAERHDRMASLLSEARAAEVPVVFANDNKGVWDADVNRLIQRALAGPGGSLLGELLPKPGERFIVKPRYSAFDHTPLELILTELDCQRLVVAGMTTEGCVAQTAIDARERDLMVTVAARACASTHPTLERTALRYLVEVVGVGLDDTLTWGAVGRGDAHPRIDRLTSLELR